MSDSLLFDLQQELAATKQKLEFAEAIIAGNNVLLSENVSAQLHIKELWGASSALIERWDTPLWKDVPHTAEYIHKLREVLAKQPDTRALDAFIKSEALKLGKCTDPCVFYQKNKIDKALLEARIEAIEKLIAGGMQTNADHRYAIREVNMYKAKLAELNKEETCRSSN